MQHENAELKAAFEVHAVAPTIFQLEFIRKLGLDFSYGNQEK